MKEFNIFKFFDNEYIVLNILILRNVIRMKIGNKDEDKK